MARNITPKTAMPRTDEILSDKPAKTLLRSWGKRLSQGTAAMIPVFVGGSWSLQIPRGNKRVLQLAIKTEKA